MMRNGKPAADYRRDVERRILGVCLGTPGALAEVASVLGDRGQYFIAPSHAAAYEWFVSTPADHHDFILLRGHLLSTGYSREDIAWVVERLVEDSLLYAKPGTPRGLARELVRIYETQVAIGYCSEVTDAVRDGGDPTDSLAGLQAALDRARGVGQAIRPISLADLRSSPPERPAPILGDGVFSRGDWMLIHARENVGKTWALLELALALATGRPWYGIETHQRHRVGIVALETGTWHAIHRMDAVWAGMLDLDDHAQIQQVEDAIQFVTKDQIGFIDLQDLAQQRWIEGWVRELSLDVLILDPLSHFLAGDEDRMGLAPILRWLEGLHRVTGCSPVLSHHDRKASTQGDQGDHGSSARGSSTIMGSARASFRLVAKRDTADGGAPIELICDKASNGPKPAPIWLRQDEATGRLLVTSSPTARRDANVQAILDLLAEGDLTTPQIAEAMASRASKRTVERHLKALLKESAVAEIPTREEGSRAWVSRWAILDGDRTNTERATRATEGDHHVSHVKSTNPDPRATRATTRDTKPVARGIDWEETF